MPWGYEDDPTPAKAGRHSKVLYLSDVQYRVILENRLTRIEVQNWFQMIAIGALLLSVFGLHFM